KDLLPRKIESRKSKTRHASDHEHPGNTNHADGDTVAHERHQRLPCLRIVPGLKRKTEPPWTLEKLPNGLEGVDEQKQKRIKGQKDENRQNGFMRERRSMYFAHG